MEFKHDKYTKQVLSLLEEGKNLFVTGKAGTGKTSLLEKIVESYYGKKYIAVLAPTGVAADYANGVTMHSFLRLPLTPYLPTHQYSGLYSLDDNSIEVVKKLDIIIIDEISMVRCDMLDATDKILRHYRHKRKSFGGIQIVMFGDLYQLMPVVKTEDWNILKGVYSSPYFFSAKALQNTDYYMVQLEKVWRQENKDFIKLLNKIRVGNIKAKDLELLNSRFEPDYRPKPKEEIITLMTHNKQAEDYNNEELAKLKGKECDLFAIKDNWEPERYPTNQILHLKKGAKVMFVKNDTHNSQYVNGTLGRVTRIGEDYVEVQLLSNKKKIIVEQQRWDRLQYRIDKKTKTIETEVIGFFKQYPLKLAWAVTVHKSQGLTFDQCVIDVSKAFTYGQVYVALSRCRSLDGIYLSNLIVSQKIKADEYVSQFLDNVDEDGKILPISDENVVNTFEKDPLVLSVSQKTIINLASGKKHSYKHGVYDMSDARKIFVTKGNELVINNVFKSKRRKFGLTDMNNGNCPFVLKKYKYVVFKNTYHNPVKMEIISDINVRESQTDDVWMFEFNLGEIIK